MFAYIWRKINSHIKFQLFFLYVAIIVIMLIALGSTFYFLFTNTILEKYSQNMSQLNKQIIFSIENNLKEIESTSLIINYDDNLNRIMAGDNIKDYLEFYNKDYMSNYEQIDRFFMNLFESRKEIYGLYIYSIDGEVSYSKNRSVSDHEIKNVSNEGWFKESIAQNGLRVLTGAHVNNFIRNDENIVISVSRAVIDFNSDKIIGVINVDENVSEFAKIIDNTNIGEKGNVIILDDKNKLVYCNDESLYKKLINLENFTDKLTLSNFSGYIGSGQGRAAVVINESQYCGWKVVTYTPYIDLMKEINVLKNIIIVILIMFIAITFALSAIIASRASKSLVIMRNLMEIVEQGNLDVMIEVKGYNEVASLEQGFNSMVSRIKNLIEKEYNQNLLRKQAELNLLQNQINPHFLYNTLGSIKSMAKSEGAAKAANMIQCLSKIFRYNLGRTGSIVTVKEELEHIKNYLFIQQQRFLDKIQVYYDIDDEVLNDKILVFTLQPIVENAIVHGLEVKQGGGEIRIKMRRVSRNIGIYISDNGIGIQNNKLDELNSMLSMDDGAMDQVLKERVGIFNVNSRLKHYFGNQYGLKIHRNYEDGITVEVVLPGTTEGNEYLKGESGVGD